MPSQRSSSRTPIEPSWMPAQWDLPTGSQRLGLASISSTQAGAAGKHEHSHQATGNVSNSQTFLATPPWMATGGAATARHVGGLAPLKICNSFAKHLFVRTANAAIPKPRNSNVYHLIGVDKAVTTKNPNPQGKSVNMGSNVLPAGR